jgi:hypothetical protein
VPLASIVGETPVPRGTSVRVTVADGAGRPVSGAAIEVSYAPPGDVEAAGLGPVRREAVTDASGGATLDLPPDRAADVRVETAAHAPAGFRVEPGDASAKEVRLDDGVRLEVRVQGPDRAGLAGAEVVALAGAGAGAGATTARRTTRTDATGAALLPPVAEGEVEVYARATGHAWASARVRARKGATSPVVLALVKGSRLLLVVEDSFGIPVEGVKVRAVPRAAGGRPGGAAASAGPDPAAWATDANGTLDVPDVADGELDLYLTKPGWREERVPRVRAPRPGSRR